MIPQDLEPEPEALEVVALAAHVQAQAQAPEMDPCADEPEPDPDVLALMADLRTRWPFAPRRLPEATVRELASIWCEILVRDLERNPLAPESSFTV